jgi:long-chain fatty acid transport protein
MRNWKTSLVLVAGMMMIGAGLAQAAGFNIYETSARSTALGCAMTASADDGTVVFYNVAGLSFLSGQRADLNVVFVAPKFQFTGKLNKQDVEATSWESKDKTFLVPGAYYANNPGKNFAFGVGVYAPFGLGLAWDKPEEYIGRRVNTDVSIETIYVTPAISYLITDQLSIGAGIDIAHQNLNLQKYSVEPQFGENAIETEIDGSSNINITPTFGLMYRPSEKVSLGANYHFEKKMSFDEGDATLTPVAPGNDPWGNALVGSLGKDQKLSSQLYLPSILQLGLGYRFSPKFRTEFNYVYFGWSAFESLALDFQNDALDQEIHFNYEDSWQIRFGFDYMASEKLSILAGYVHDETPQPLASVSPILPDTDRNDYSFGLQYRTGKWELNGSYMYVDNSPRTNIENDEPVRNSTDYPFGTYSTHAHLFGLGASYLF